MVLETVKGQHWAAEAGSGFHCGAKKQFYGEIAPLRCLKTHYLDSRQTPDHQERVHSGTRKMVICVLTR